MGTFCTADFPVSYVPRYIAGRFENLTSVLSGGCHSRYWPQCCQCHVVYTLPHCILGFAPDVYLGTSRMYILLDVDSHTGSALLVWFRRVPQDFEGVHPVEFLLSYWICLLVWFRRVPRDFKDVHPIGFLLSCWICLTGVVQTCTSEL